MQVSVSDNWVTAGAIIGTLIFSAGGAFWKLYAKSREDVREAVSGPAVVANAVGAAFVDRNTAQDVSAIRDDVRAIRNMAEDRREHDAEERVKQIAIEAARAATRGDK